MENRPSYNPETERAFIPKEIPKETEEAFDLERQKEIERLATLASETEPKEPTDPRAVEMLKRIRTGDKSVNDTYLDVWVKNSDISLDQIAYLREEIKGTDPLTGLYNRSKFDTESRIEFARSMRDKKEFSICVIDFNKFKEINDTYGHATGDYVLANVSSLLKNCLRDSDIIARIGGDELIVFLPNTNLEQATEVIERNLNILEQTEIFSLPSAKHPQVEKLNVTLSCGLKAFQQNKESRVHEERLAQSAQSATQFEEVLLKQVIDQADAAAYQAKRLGGNQVALAA